jgi:4-amino-4-deoxy-L-arabinose transferase-like glycosyltransferase
MTIESAISRPSDFTRLLVLVLLAAGLRTFTVLNTTVPSRDCIVFVRNGLWLESPPDGMSRLDVIRNVEHPPGYPSAIIAVSWLVRPFMGGITPESMALSAQLVSAASAILLIFPLFLLTRRLFDRNVAFVAVAMFEVLPAYVDVSSDGISDSFWLLTAAWALWFGVRAIEQERIRLAFLFGLGAGAFCGLGYIIRPDSAIVATGIGLTFAGIVIRRLRRSAAWRPPFVAGIGLTLGTFLAMSPYCIAIEGLSKKVTAVELINRLMGKEHSRTFFQRGQSARPGVTLPIASWWDPSFNEGDSKLLWAARSLGEEYFKAAHYVIPVFGVVGLFALRRRLIEARLAVLLVTASVHLAVLWFLAWQIDYVSQRHTLLTVMISCMFAAASFPIIGAWIIRSWKTPLFAVRTPWGIGAVFTLLVLAISLPRDLRSLHHERAGHKAAGYWLKEHAEGVAIVDPFGWAEWYTGRTLREWPWLNPTDDRPIYIVFTPNAKSPHSRLERYVFARDRYQRGELVFAYPPDASADKIEIGIYFFKPEVPKKK